MTFAGRGISVKRGLHSESALIVLVLALLLLCTHSWGACTAYSNNYYYPLQPSGFVQKPCYYQPSRCGCDNGCQSGWSPSYCSMWQGYCSNGETFLQGGAGGCPSTYSSQGKILTGAHEICGQYQDICAVNYSGCFYDYQCTTQAEADSINCLVHPTAEGCVEEDVPASCQNDYQQCVGLGGVWRKTASTATECASECDLCNSAAQTKVLNTWNKVCCQQGKAPPDSSQRCIPPRGGSGGGMQSSQFVNNDGNISCGSLTTADGEIIQENAALYKRFCIDQDEYEEQVDTNDVGGSSSSGEGGGSSSSEGEPPSFGTELEALGGLYGVLDTIRDTLVKRLTPATEEIRDCLYNFKLCTALEPLQIDWTGMPRDTSIFNVDTAILKHIKPMMDSSVKLDSAQLKVLKQLDSLYKRGLVNDTDIVQAVNAIKGDINEVESAVKGVRHGIDSLIDSMTTHLEKVGQGLGAVGDSIGELRGMLQGYLDGVTPDDTNGDGYYGDYIGGSDTMGSGYLGGVFGGIIEEGSHDSNFTGIFDTSGFMSDSLLADSIGKLPSLDSMKAVLDSSVEADYTRLADTLQAAFDTLKEEIMLINFDSLILQPLGARVPNTNTCPDHCFTFSVSNGEGQAGSWMGSVGTLTFPLCSNLPGMNFDVFVLIRVIARLVVAIGCIYIGIWFISGRKI